MPAPNNVNCIQPDTMMLPHLPTARYAIVAYGLRVLLLCSGKRSSRISQHAPNFVPPYPALMQNIITNIRPIQPVIIQFSYKRNTEIFVKT